jgi:hypothetical protein
MSDTERPRPRLPAEVERDIDHTRVELTRTLDAIERRLDVRSLVQEGFDMLNASFIGGEPVRRGLAAVRANPVPFALFGIGAAWLLAGNTKAGSYAAGKAGEYAGELGQRAGTLATDMAGKVGIGPAAASEQPLGHTGNPVVDAAEGSRSGGWVHQASFMAQGALRTVRDSGGAAVNYAGDGADRLTGAAQRHPLLIGSIAVVAGALVAALLPLSRVENDWIGTTRDDLWQRAEEFGQETVARARDAASRAAGRAVDAATETIKETIKEEIAKPAAR